MKYVFVAHSHTLLLTSLGAIEYLKLDAKDVIFLCTRNYNSLFFMKGAKVVRADECDELGELILRSRNGVYIKEKIRKIDELIEQWVQDRYELFVPHLWGGFLSLLYTHKLCCKVSYVQEGAHTSKSFFVPHLSLYKKIKRKILFYKRYGNSRFYCNAWYVDGVLKNDAILDAYAIYEEFFKDLPCNLHIVSWPSISCDLPLKIDGPVFIFDGFVNIGLAEMNYYLEQCKTMIEKFHKVTNYIKFHPAQGKDECMQIESFFKNCGAKYFVLDSAVPFEFYLMKLKGLTLIGMGSSLLFFAYYYGHNVISCDSWMMGDPRYKNNHDKGYPLFHEYFPNIKEVMK